MRLDGTRVVVTGASRGLGERLANAAAARGARVALVARSAEAIGKLAAELGGDAYPCDLSDATGIERLARAIEADGPVDVLVNNAGIDLAGRLTDVATDDVVQLFNVNLLAPVLLARAMLPAMIERGRGQIVNISSLAGTNAIPGVTAYSASKAGLSHFSAVLRAELRGLPIGVTLVELGPFEGTMIESLRSHAPTRRALERLRRLRLTVDLDVDAVVRAIVGAIERDKRHVRMPARDVAFPLLVESPRRMTEWLLAGVDHQSD